MITEVRQMIVEDMLLIMELNADMYPEFAALSEEHKRQLINVNILSGEAKSYFENGRLVGVAGIKFVGVGEAWLITPPNVRSAQGLELFNDTKDLFVKMRDDNHLWRIFADDTISGVFLKRLGFKPNPKNYVWTRE